MARETGVGPYLRQQGVAFPRIPGSLLMLATWLRPAGSLERFGRRYGHRIGIRLPFRPPAILLSDPADVEALFKVPPDAVHPGEGARILQPVLGKHSVILLDEAPHLEQRKLLLPAFHGDRMQRMAGVMTELAEREVEALPTGEPIAIHPRLQHLAFEMIMRVVFGLEQGERLDRLRVELSDLLAWTESPISYMVPLDTPKLAWLGPVRRFRKLRERTDALIFDLIEERRAEIAAGGEQRDDILSTLLEARHSDGEGTDGAGEPMSAQEIRDELVTALVAGHETTASQLSWACAILARSPEVVARIVDEIEAGEEEYLTATIHEVMRVKPVLPQPAPRLTTKPVQIGPVRYPAGVLLIASVHLLHRNADVHSEPEAFRPERFLGRAPGTYTWIPFGGGRRRCIGASFAMLEMKVILRALLERCELEPASPAPEGTRRRLITFSPAYGGRVVLRRRLRAPAPSIALHGR